MPYCSFIYLATMYCENPNHIVKFEDRYTFPEDYMDRNKATVTKQVRLAGWRKIKGIWNCPDCTGKEG